MLNNIDKNTVLLIAGIALAVLNLISFILMAHDKRAAIRGAWRVPEKTLFISAACFGALGGTLGMFLLRHKTKHWYFELFFPLMMVAQVLLLAFGAVKLFN